MTIPHIDKFIGRLKYRHRLTAEIILYAEGVKAKLNQATYACDKLIALQVAYYPSVGGGTTPPSNSSILNEDELIAFYCESCWDFLRSSLDITAQVVNQVCRLGMVERDVDFKRVCEAVANSNSHSGTKLDRSLQRCLRSKSFIQLEDYRHCSTHRRQVYIEKEMTQKTVSGTSAYDLVKGIGTSPSSEQTIWYLCKNPWDLNPTIDRNRMVATYNGDVLGTIGWHISAILNSLI